MEVYHASTVVVEHPDTTHSRAFLDFGPGFYVTTLLGQAQKYGERFVRRGKEAMDIFYNSPLLPLLEEGVADLHCRSDKYLAEEIWREKEENKE